MAKIFHSFPVLAPLKDVFTGISTPKGLNRWWSKNSAGIPALKETYNLSFGPGYDWSAIVSKYVPEKNFELTITKSDPDWDGTRVGFSLDYKDGATQVHFYHTGWKAGNQHFRISCYCWAMYLRILKRNLEHGEQVPYEKRLDV